MFYNRFTPPLSYVVNRPFQEERRLLTRSERYSRDELDALKMARLGRILRHAYGTCVYYRRTFDEAGLNPEAVRYPDQIRVLPLLTKAILQEQLPGLTSSAIPEKKRWYVTTGGSTGTPTGFYLEHGVSYQRTYAYEWRQYNWGRIGFFQRRVVMRGRVMEPLYEKEANNLYLSAFKLTPTIAPDYLDILEDFNPDYIEAYPSAIAYLAKLIADEGRAPKLPRLKSIFLSSETAPAEQIRDIKAVFQCRVFNKYGNSEQATIIGQCEHGTMHEFEEYAFTEYLDDASNPVEGGEAEIVSTTFVNDATPLIRYRTEDRVILDDIECPCGRTHRTVAGVAGRNQDTLVGRNGEKISVAAINTHTDVYDGVLGFQYFQEKPGEAVVRIIPRGEISDDQKRRIVDEATFRTDHTVHFTIEQVDELQKTPRGKSLFIVRTFS